MLPLGPAWSNWLQQNEYCTLEISAQVRKRAEDAYGFPENAVNKAVNNLLSLKSINAGDEFCIGCKALNINIDYDGFNVRSGRAAVRASPSLSSSSVSLPSAEDAESSAPPASGSCRSGAVATAEAAAAVADMLAAAGLPAGADTRSLLAEALALRAERDRLAAGAAKLEQVRVGCVHAREQRTWSTGSGPSTTFGAASPVAYMQMCRYDPAEHLREMPLCHNSASHQMLSLFATLLPRDDCIRR